MPRDCTASSKCPTNEQSAWVGGSHTNPSNLAFLIPLAIGAGAVTAGVLQANAEKDDEFRRAVAFRSFYEEGEREKQRKADRVKEIDWQIAHGLRDPFTREQIPGADFSETVVWPPPGGPTPTTSAPGSLPLNLPMAPRRNGSKPTRAARQRSKTPATTSRGRSRTRRMTVPPPSTVSMAPVSIGNTVRGVQTAVVATKNGVAVCGRDFMFTPIGTGTVETWCLAGGAPLSPAAFVDSVLRQHMQMYNKFRFLNITAHYITSSPTSSDGDILFYHNKNRESVFLNQTSNNLLPFVISDPNTVLGPQWQNHSAHFDVAADWKSTDYGMSSEPGLYADGDLFILTRSTTTDSPGYVLFDYVIEFAEKSTIPRLLFLPAAKILWTNVAFEFANAAAVTNAAIFAVPGGNTLSGSPSANPTGKNNGDVYKVIFDRTNSTLGANSGFFLNNNQIVSNVLTTIQTTVNDGYTCYAVASGNGWAFFATVAAAVAGRTLNYSGTGAIGSSIVQTWVSFVTSIEHNVMNPSF